MQVPWTWHLRDPSRLCFLRIQRFSIELQYLSGMIYPKSCHRCCRKSPICQRTMCHYIRGRVNRPLRLEYPDWSQAGKSEELGASCSPFNSYGVGQRRKREPEARRASTFRVVGLCCHGRDKSQSVQSIRESVCRRPQIQFYRRVGVPLGSPKRQRQTFPLSNPTSTCSHYGSNTSNCHDRRTS